MKYLYTKTLAWVGLSLFLLSVLAYPPAQEASKSRQEARADRGQTQVAPAAPSTDGKAQPVATASKTASGKAHTLKQGRVKAARLLTAEVGWAVTQNRLLWTISAGKQWKDITPSAAGSRSLDGAFFLDESKGWVVMSGSESDQNDSVSLELASTVDGGKTWTVRPLAPDGEQLKGYGRAASIDFVDAHHGWVMLRLATSSNFSKGVLYTTSNGGQTWDKLSEPPLGDPIDFVTATEGWLAGGPGTDKLYLTRDGGNTWTPKSVEPPTASQGGQALYTLPKFWSSQDGTMAVTSVGEKGSTITLYSTDNRGETWRAISTLPLGGSFSAEAKTAYSVVDSGTVIVTPPNQDRLVTVSKVGGRRNMVALKSLPRDGRIVEVDFKSGSEGWLLVSVGRCEEFKRQCRQETRLFSTSDAGKTLTDVTPNLEAANASEQNPDIELKGGSLPIINGPGGSIRISNKKGFDKCAAGTVSNMQTWWNSSPYWDANIYIGGISRSCTQANLNAAWVDQVSAQGWGLIPTWVGPQAPCTTYANRISTNTATAQTQGANEADSAANAAASLGLTQGTIIYYDLEHYNADATCSAAVKAFLNGWVQRMHARGNVAGVYGSPINASADWASIANPPDAVWIAKWDDRETVWGLTPLSDSLWFNHQRIHQYHGGHNETWGGITFNIDNNIADGPVAGTSSQNLPNLTPYQPTGWSDKIVVSNTTGTNTDSTTLRTTDALRVDWAVVNNGTAATGTTFHTRLYVDGVERGAWFTDPPLSVNFYTSAQDFSIGSLSAGTHTVKIVTDTGGAISEGSESDNEYTKTITVTAQGQPNLTPFQPAGWSNKIVVSTATGSNTDSTTLRSTDTLYVDWAAINNGAAATGATFHTKLFVDGVERISWFTDPPLNVNSYAFIQDYSIGTLSAGTHTIKIVADSGGAIAESNESDNEFSRTITVVPGGQPNLTPHQPAGWADKIVVSNVTGTNTNSSPIKTTDILYVDWAAINNGTAATGAIFHAKLYVDGVERATWFTDPPLNVNSYAFVQDFSIGTLSAGNHTIRIVTDSGGALAETNEADNEYTKTVTVIAPPTCFTLITNISPSGSGNVTRSTAPNCSSGMPSLMEQAEPLRPEPVVAAASISSDSGVGRSAATEEAFRTLLTKAAAGGTVRVIIGLDIAFQPEGTLASPQQVQSQQGKIAAAQDALLVELSAFDVRSVKKFPFIPYMAMEVDAAGVRYLAASTGVSSIQEDIPVPPSLAQSVSLIGAPAAWASGFTGAGQVVAILDTGVDKSHPFLSGKVVAEACYSTSNSSSSSVCPGGVAQSTGTGSGVNCSASVNGCDHGTHVAGIAAGKGSSFSGVAKDANVIAVQVFSRFNSQTDCGDTPAPCALTYPSDYILGLQRVQALSGSFSIAAANMSLGGGRNFSNCDALEGATKAAIDGLRSVGIATIIASGNKGFADSIGSPACISTAVSVGSTDDGSLGTTADVVSSFLPSGGSNSASFLHLLAPGKWIDSSVPGGTPFRSFQGTSMAAPHVTGAWAVLKSKSPSATVDQVLSALTSTGIPVTDSRNGITKPRIKVDAAVNALGGGGGGQYTSGTVVTLTAIPSAGFSFQSWSGCDSVSGSNCTVTMNASRNVTANFTQIQTRTLTVASSNPGSGINVTVSPGDNSGQGSGATQFSRVYNDNTVVSLTAPATAGGNIFQKWQRDGVDVSTNQATSVTMNANRTMTAVYVSLPATVQFSAAGLGVGESGGRINVAVTRTGNTSGTSTASYRTMDNAAEVGCANTTMMPGVSFARCDYATSVGTVSFAPGEVSKSFAVPIIDDGHVEPSETFQITLSNPSGGTSLGAAATSTVTISDNDTASTANPIFASSFFVRMHYLDFLSREPEVGEPWTNVLNNCPNRFNTNPLDPSARCDFNLVSSSFFRAPEFELKGGFVFRFYRVAFNRLPLYGEIIPDMSSVTGLTAQEVFAKKADFSNSFVTRADFASAYGSLSNDAYVNTLLGRYALTSVTTPDPAAPDGATKVTLSASMLISRLSAGTLTRAQVLRAIADSDQVGAREFNRAFVAMQYYGYLRRTPEPTGFNNWLNYLNANPQDFRTMINGFINSTEYRLRFGN